ncbi:MAG: S9 family peptidase [bacterium]
MKRALLALLATSFLAVGCPPSQTRTADRRRPEPRLADPDLIPRRVIFGNPKKTSLRISPDGTRVSYLAPVNGVLNVWVQTIGGNDATAVTRDRYRGIRSYDWTQDAKSILYLQDVGGDENYRIYQVELASGKVTLHTPDKDVRAGIVAVSKHHPGTVLISMNKRNRRLFDVYRLELATGKVTLEATNPGSVVSWVADFGFQIRAALAIDQKGQKSLLVRDAPDKPWRTIRTWSHLESGGPAAFTKDGKAIIALGNKGSDKTRLYTIGVADGKITEIYTNPKADLSGVELNPDDNHIEAVSTEYIRKEWKVIDPKLKPDLNALRKLAAGNRFGIVNRTHDDKRWVVAVGGPNLPVRYYLYDRPAKRFKLLVATRLELKNYKLSPMKPVIIPARDGLPLVCYLTTPSKPFPGKQPLVLFVHGGPWSRDKYSYHPWVQWLANRGYVVLQVNFRGSSGFGKKYLNAGNKEWGRKMQHDLSDAVKWAIDNAQVDPKRVGIMGGSYGGYATLAGVAFTPDLYAAAVDIVGPSSILTLLKSIPPYWKPLMAVFRVRVGDIDSDKDMLKARSPLYFADRIKTPLAIFQGANDPRVKIGESNQIVAAIRKRGGKVLYVVYPDEGHGFRREPNRMDFLARTEEFLGKHLRGRVQPFAEVPGSKGEVR